jgi:hypothetical protein
MINDKEPNAPDVVEQVVEHHKDSSKVGVEVGVPGYKIRFFVEHNSESDTKKEAHKSPGPEKKPEDNIDLKSIGADPNEKSLTDIRTYY